MGIRPNRRDFLGGVAGIVAGTALQFYGTEALGKEEAAGGVGVLADTTLCIGCRECEAACAQSHALEVPSSIEPESGSVFETERVPDTSALTVVNRYLPANGGGPVFVKKQCMHCVKPSCVSACIVGALEKTSEGAVVYDYGKCIGCRYCMVACPFGVPAYEFSEPLKPRVMKCDLCAARISHEMGIPACVDECPVSCLTFGRRDELLVIARRKLADSPDKYFPVIFGEHEVGGTAWMYLLPASPEQLGFPAVGKTAPAETSEKIQHSVFKNWIPPISLYALLGVSTWIYGRRKEVGEKP